METAKHVHGRFKASRHKFVFNNSDTEGGTAIDGDVVAEQSRKQIKENKDLTIIVHHHMSSMTCDGNEHDAYGVSLASAAV